MVHLQDYNDPPVSRKPWFVAAGIVVVVVAAILWWVHESPAPATAAVKPSVPAPVQPAPSKPIPAPAPAVPVVAVAPSATAGTSNPAPAAVAAAIPASALEAATTLEKEGRLVEAREACLAILESCPGASGLAAVEEKAAALGLTLLLKPHPMPEKVDYVVAGGDSLDKIARKFGCTKELLATNNMIARAALIKKGDRFRVFNGTFKVLVNKTRNDLLLTMNGRFFKRYAIGTGKFGKTPVGTFVLVDRIAQPVWWKPDGKAVPFGHPENILGTHWLAMKPTGNTPLVAGYGIHGTWDDASIGKAESAGCVRMHNADVEQLYVLLPVGTAVEIVE